MCSHRGSCLVEFDAACAWCEFAKVVSIRVDPVAHIYGPLFVVVVACAVGELSQGHVRLIDPLVLVLKRT
jgi:hypothetical protein